MRSWGLVAAVCVTVAVGGCRAQVDAPDGGPDLAGADGGEDLAIDLDGGGDLASTDLACAGPAMPEICNNGCDDDHNGYVDEDDPACTPQLLITLPGAAGAPALWRLKLGPKPLLSVLDGNPVPSGTCGAEYQRAFSERAFLVNEAAPGTIRVVALADGGTGTVNDFQPGYATRDACVFNGELIVVQRTPGGVLHRFKADGLTEVGMVSLGTLLATGCASDGKLLYVAVHDINGTSQFLAFDKTLQMAPGSPFAVPPTLVLNGFAHCLDLAWTRFGFYGLFTNNLSNNDPALSATQIYPFAFDGGVGTPIPADKFLPDGGQVHGIGEFLP